MTPPAGHEKLTRRERAQATRGRILDAAEELFPRHGYAGTRMADIAAGAGVAVQTVYFTFHTKVELLDACFARAVMGEEDPRPPQEQPWWEAMLAAPDAAEALHHFVSGNAAIAARVSRLDQVVKSALHEPGVAALREQGEQLRRAGYREVVDLLERRFGLREGLDRENATDLLLVMGDHPTYCSLVHEYGWTHAAFVEWLTGTLTAMLVKE